MNRYEVAETLVNQALNSKMFKVFKRFDVVIPGSIRMYGRVTNANGSKVFMIQNIEIEPKYQGKGLFNAIVDQANNLTGLKVYIQCVENESWFASLEASTKWQKVGTQDFIQA